MSAQHPIFKGGHGALLASFLFFVSFVRLAVRSYLNGFEEETRRGLARSKAFCSA